MSQTCEARLHPTLMVLSSDVSLAAATVRAGGVIAYPTEAVFGLGCDPLNEQAVDRLLDLKQRPRDKGLIVVAANFTQLKPFLRSLGDDITQRVMRTWPGPVTWLIPALDETPEWLLGRFATLAVRVTAHPIAAELCRLAGTAIVSTSANIADQPPAKSADAVRRIFDTRVDVVLDGTLGDSDCPTEIRDALTGRIVRAG